MSVATKTQHYTFRQLILPHKYSWKVSTLYANSFLIYNLLTICKHAVCFDLVDIPNQYSIKFSSYTRSLNCISIIAAVVSRGNNSSTNNVLGIVAVVAAVLPHEGQINGPSNNTKRNWCLKIFDWIFLGNDRRGGVQLVFLRSLLILKNGTTTSNQIGFIWSLFMTGNSIKTLYTPRT